MSETPDEMAQEIFSLHAANAALTKKLTACQADTERLDWLFTHLWYNRIDVEPRIGEQVRIEGNRKSLDAARSTPERGGPIEACGCPMFAIRPGEYVTEHVLGTCGRGVRPEGV